MLLERAHRWLAQIQSRLMEGRMEEGRYSLIESSAESAIEVEVTVYLIMQTSFY